MNDVNNRLYQLARSQVDMLKSALGKRFAFEDNKDNEVLGGYTTYGTMKTPTAIIVLRISNHVCSMNNWTERYNPKLIPNNKLLRRMGKNLQDPYKDRLFFSVVFKAFDYQTNDAGSWNAICNEYIFNPYEVEESRTIERIAQDCLKINIGEPISINGTNPNIRKSTRNNNKTNENRNMKQTIRLTESDLHNLIREAINELDWRTYANAAKKSDSMGDNDRAEKFRRHAMLTVGKTHRDKNGEVSRASIDFGDDGEPYPYGWKKDVWGNYHQIEGFGDDPEGYSYTSDDYPGDTFAGNPDYLGDLISQHYRKLEKQANDYRHNKSEYVPGEGWKAKELDESIRRAIRKYLR